MTTSRHDLRHGRQGGRVVDWVAFARPHPIGSRRQLDAGPGGRPVVVVVSQLDGCRSLVELPSGSRLTVPDDLLTVSA